MGYEAPAVPLWHFRPSGRMTANDLVKITYDNGSVLYVAKSGEKWIVDRDLIPPDLQDIRGCHDVTEFEVVRCSERGLQSGSIGSSLVIHAYSGGKYVGRKIRCVSVPIVMAIAPAIRPLESADTPPAFVVEDESTQPQ